MHHNSTRQPADKVRIVEWHVPQPSLIPSTLDEEAQLESLQIHVDGLNRELEEHNGLEPLIGQYYGARSSNGSKTRTNWSAKSHHLHSEIGKYEVYTASLRSAIALRVKKQGEKKLEHSLARGMSMAPNEAVE